MFLGGISYKSNHMKLRQSKLNNINGGYKFDNTYSTGIEIYFDFGWNGKSP